MIPYSRQSISVTDCNNVLKVLKSSFLTQGPKVKEFEKKIKKFTGSKFAVATNSGSSSLHIACLALGVKKNDIVWTVPNTFVASANCAINCGAKIDFVDINNETFNISIEKLKNKLILAKKNKKLPKVIIPVHLGGQPSEQKKIWKLSLKYKFKILEDASHSIGAKHYGNRVGNCKWSHITVFSFHPVKIITTGEGGISLTNNKDLNYKMRLFRDNGISRERKSLNKHKKKSIWHYEHLDSGFNYRMNDISAALGISQLKRINQFIKRRNQIAKLYNNLLKDIPIKTQKILPYNYSSYHLFIIQFDLKKTKLTYNQIFNLFRNNNYYVNLHYMPLHLSPYFKKLGFRKNDFPNSEEYQKKTLSLPIFYDLKKISVIKIVNLIKKIYKA
tara:strand:- start:280 stop:1443 length:1164 start_codon:yes stop_codon:yes gene_type:complete